MATKRELEAQIQELEEENAELQDQLDAIADIVGGGEEDEDEEDGGEDEDDQDGSDDLGE